MTMVDKENIKERVHNTVGNNNFVSRAESKKLLQEIYDEVGIDKRAAGTHLREFYRTKDKMSYIRGKQVHGFEILSKK